MINVYVQSRERRNIPSGRRFRDSLISKVGLRVNWLVLCVAFLTAVSAGAQELTTHGAIASFSPTEAVVNLVSNWTVEEGHTGQAYTTTTIDGQDISLWSAQLRVARVVGRTVTCTIVNASATNRLQIGQMVSFHGVVSTNSGRIFVESTPSGAAVFIDGEPSQIGVTPTTLPLSAGEHILRFASDGYEDQEQAIQVIPGERQHVVINLRPDARLATLTIQSSPSGAVADVDGLPFGTTPLTQSLRPGHHNVRIWMTGYSTHEQALVLRAAQRFNLRVTLDSLKTVAVPHEPDSTILFVNGKNPATTVLSRLLPAGFFGLKVGTTGKNEEQQHIEISGDGAHRLEIRVIPLEGILSVHSDPSGVDVFLEQQNIGRTPLTFSLEPGRYHLQVGDGKRFEYYERDIDVVSRQIEHVDVSLQPTVLLIPSAGQDSNVDNVRVERQVGLVTVEYDLDGSANTYEIDISVSTDGGRSFRLHPEIVFGDVGKNIAPGKYKRIVWKYAEEFPNGLAGGWYPVRVTAKPQQSRWKRVLLVSGAAVLVGGALYLLSNDRSTLGSIFPGAPGRPAN